MAKPLSILFVTSEIYPYAKESGIGDFAYSFTLAMRELGHDIRVMTPKYGNVSERKNKIHEINRLRDIPIPIGDEAFPATVKSSSLSNPRYKVQAYITTNYKYFDSRKGIYHDLATWKLFDDNFERFLYFSRSVVETCMLLGWYPDIIHCNDWHTAIIPAYLKLLYPSKFKKTRTVLTIHNLKGQPEIPVSEFTKTGLPKDALQSFKHKNMINLFKAGVIYANYITTVSPTYAKILLTDKEYTNGLNSIFKEYSNKFKGILNGIEQYTWNPANDYYVHKKYDGNAEEFKYHNKVELCKKVGLEFDSKKPIFGIISKLDASKGLEFILEAIPEFIKKDLQLVILGLGDAEIQKKLEKLAKKYSNKLKVVFSMDENLAHQIEAGTDFFILPSINEPFGLNLLYSLAYGSIPVVHYSGGFIDTAIDIDENPENGNAIVFKNHTKDDLLQSIKRALALFSDKNKLLQLIEKNMQGDYSWRNSASQYDEIYRNIIKEQNA